jgi:hypothetical protein
MAGFRQTKGFEMKRAVVTIALLLCAFLVAGYLHEIAIAQQEKTTTNLEEAASFTLRDVYPVIRLKSRVLPELPTFLPYTDKDDPAHAIIESVDQLHYQIMLAWVVPCAGGHNCLYGSVRGSAVPFTAGEGRSVPVTLLRGIQGNFIESECTINCTQAYLEWSDGGFYYCVGVKAGKKRDLVKMANSAIAAGQPKMK